MRNSNQSPTFDRHIGSIVNSGDCGKHRARPGDPCWLLEGSNGALLFGVCNKRAKKAGYSHPISEKSLRKHSSR